MSKVRASILQSRKRFVVDGYGEEAWRRVLGSLSSEHRHLLSESVPSTQWQPFALFVELNLAIDRLLGNGDLSMCKQLGYFGADYNLPTIFRVFYRVSSVGFIMRRASQLWGKHYDSGTVRVEEHQGKHVSLHIENFDTPHKTHCLSVQGWCERAIELSGGKNPVSEIVACRVTGDARCSIECHWN